MILLCLHNYKLSYDNYLICFTEDINKIGQDKVKYNIWSNVTIEVAIVVYTFFLPAYRHR